MVLSRRQVESFVEQGFVRLEGAFPRSLADECRALLWEQLAPMRPDEPSTWDRPVAGAAAESLAGRPLHARHAPRPPCGI